MRRLRQFEWEDNKQVVRASFETMLGTASDSLQSRVKEQRDAKQRIDAMLDELEKPWAIKCKPTWAPFDIGTTPDAEQAEQEPATLDHTNWRTATIEWLQQPHLFTPASLPKMQVPSSKSRGVYETPEQYMDTTERLMVGMTFSDGHAALAPQCHERDAQGKGCGCTLWLMASKGGSSSQLSCRTRGCSRQVAWACQNSRHSRGLCSPCAKLEQARLAGSASPQASTHVYDGVISRVDVGGKLYVERYESRSPPNAKNPDGTSRPIHWRSTKRLACPNLVGVVRLGTSSTSKRVKGRALQATDKILWGELSNHGPPKDEHMHRQSGRLCLNMTNITGSFDVELFTEGDLVAIIDCMTFVPEYIPVLLALEQQKLSKLPFDDGAMLNLWQSRPADLSNTIGHELAGVAAGAGDGGGVLNRHDVARLVRDMIELSRLQPIREIRQRWVIEEMCSAD